MVERSTVGRMLHRTPVTIALFLTTVAFAVAGRGLRGPSLRLRLALGTGYEQVIDLHRWWTPVSSVFLTDGGLELPLVLCAIIFVVGPAERLLGPLRTAVAFAVTAIAGAVVGIIVQQVGTALGELWSRRVTELVTLDPMTAIAGTIMTASAYASSLWRRRIRVLTFSVVLVFLLYSGQPSDLYRAIAALAGLALGVALKPGEGAIRWQRSSHHEARILLSAVVTITAVGPAITLFSRLRLGPLAPLGLLLTDARPSGLPTVDECHAMRITRSCLHDMTLERISGVGPVLLTVLPLLTLVVAAIGLSRGRRFAAWLAITVNVALAALGAYFYGFLPLFGHRVTFRFSTPHYWEVSLAIAVSVAVPLAIAAAVALNLRHVTVRASRRSVGGYLVAVLVALIGLSALYVGAGSLMPRSFHPRVAPVDLLADLPERFIPIGFVRMERLVFLPTHPIVSFLYYWIGPLFWFVVVAGALFVVLAPGARLEAAGLARIRRLLRVGSGSLGFWSTWDGNSYWFSADGRAAVAYRVVNGVALTASEPIGPSGAAAAAIGEFARYCDDNGWTPVFYSIHDDALAVCAEMGWSSMSIGDETVILPGEWKTEGKRWQDIRSSINRAERLQVRSLWTSYSALSPAHSRQIGEISEQWVAEKDLPEMGFTLGGMEELRDHEVRLMLACDSNDHVVGVTSWLPTWRDGMIVGWTLDFMRRAPDGMNGIMEFLIARSAELFREQGVEFMSLSAAPLAHASVGAGETGGAVRMLAYIGSRLEPVYGFRSLFAFKRKFQPEFRPLWMAYPDPIALPAIGLALARAYLPSLSVRESIRLIRTAN